MIGRYEQLLPVGEPSVLWKKYFVEHTRMGAHQADRYKILRTVDRIPHGLRAEYLRQRQERLRKRLE